MGLFKSDEERKLEEERKLKEAEEEILTSKKFWGKVGATHTGWNFSDGLRNADKTKFKPTKVKIYDDKILIERNRQVIQLVQIKEIFFEDSFEAIIILTNGDGIPIQGRGATGRRELKAFVNVLTKLVEDYKSNHDNIESRVNNNEKSEDKIDKLIKLGNMHDKGLLSDEEFASLKKELLSGNNKDATNTPKDTDEPSADTCEKCGAKISPEDAFCSECGNELN